MHQTDKCRAARRAAVAGEAGGARRRGRRKTDGVSPRGRRHDPCACPREAIRNPCKYAPSRPLTPHRCWAEHDTQPQARVRRDSSRHGEAHTRAATAPKPTHWGGTWSDRAAGAGGERGRKVVTGTDRRSSGGDGKRGWFPMPVALTPVHSNVGDRTGWQERAPRPWAQQPSHKLRPTVQAAPQTSTTQWLKRRNGRVGGDSRPAAAGARGGCGWEGRQWSQRGSECRGTHQGCKGRGRGRRMSKGHWTDCALKEKQEWVVHKRNAGS